MKMRWIALTLGLGTALLDAALDAKAASLKKGVFLVQDFEGSAALGVPRVAVNVNGLPSTLNPQPFVPTAGGAPGTPGHCGRIYGHLGPNRPPYSWAQLVLPLSPEQTPVDLGAFKSLRFWIKGDGRRHVVKLMKRSITDYDQYRFEFPTTTTWKELAIPLTAFTQAGWGRPVPRIFDDVDAVQFEAGVFDADYDFSVDDVRLSVEEARLDPEPYDTRGWFPYSGFSPQRRRGTALDASGRLDAPAGKHGWVLPRGEDFVFEKTGRPVRFFGVNLVAGCNFLSHEQAESLAETLAQMGVNIVRLHHADAPWATRNFFGKGPTTRKLDPESMDRFDYLVAQLQKRGIYLYLDLLVHRPALAADGIQAVDDIVNGWKIEGQFDPQLIALQQEFVTQLLKHRNPYSGRIYGRDPGIAGMEIINEDSLWFRKSGHGDFSITSEHEKRIYQNLFNRWLLAKYKTRAALALAWASSAVEENGLGDDEDPVAGTVQALAGWDDTSMAGFTQARLKDAWAFDGALMADYFGKMERLVRSLGYRGPLTGSNHWISHPADLALNAKLGYIDRHAYWAHPQGGWDYSPGVTFDPNPLLKHPEAGIVGELAARRVKGLPFIVTEWGSCAPNDYRADGPLTMGVACSLQNWSAIQFAFSHTDQRDFENYRGALDSFFDVIYQPVWMTLWPAVATMLQRGDVAALRGPGAWTVFSPEELADPRLQRQGSGVAVFAAPTGVAFDGSQGLRPEEARAAATQEGWVGPVQGGVRHHPTRGLLSVDTPRSAALAGFVGGSTPLRAGVLEARVDNPYAVLLLTSLDDQPLSQSARMLLVAGANAVNTGMVKRWGGGGIAQRGSEPVLVEPVVGTLSVACDGPRQVWALDADGRRRKEQKSRYADGRLYFELAPDARALAWELVVP